ncbi:MAG: hypothetical protein U0325_20440 [Polyangiales bacterium]
MDGNGRYEWPQSFDESISASRDRSGAWVSTKGLANIAAQAPRRPTVAPKTPRATRHAPRPASAAR